MSDIGDRIKALRKKRGLTQVQLSRLSGVSQSNVSQYERFIEPSASALSKIATALDTTVDYLVGRTDDPEPPPKFSPWVRKMLAIVATLDHEPTVDDLVAIILDNLPEESELGDMR
jgi:transcriptional regulator with XRE-family HTH domain